MADPLIVSELQTPASHGIDSITRSYTNPGGAPRGDSIADIEANTALMNQDDIAVYKASLMSDEFFTILTAEGLTDLAAGERADYAAFIVPMLAGGNIKNPSSLLKDLVNAIFDGTGEDPAIRSNFEALIRENKSVAEILEVRAKAGDVEQAMLQLGWIV
ncbi:MAG: hypothetical protein V3T88_07445 [Nitrosomonadaceae bacterium]